MSNPKWHKGIKSLTSGYEVSVSHDVLSFDFPANPQVRAEFDGYNLSCGPQTIKKIVGELLKTGTNGTITLSAPNGRHKVVVNVAIIPERPAKQEGKKVSFPLEGFIDSELNGMILPITLNRGMREIIRRSLPLQDIKDSFQRRGRKWLAENMDLDHWTQTPQLDILCDDVEHELDLIMEANGPTTPAFVIVPWFEQKTGWDRIF